MAFNAGGSLGAGRARVTSATLPSPGGRRQPGTIYPPPFSRRLAQAERGSLDRSRLRTLCACRASILAKHQMNLNHPGNAQHPIETLLPPRRARQALLGAIPLLVRDPVRMDFEK
jgi:hypothetical protein